MAILFKENFENGDLGGFKVSGIPPTATSEILPRVGTHCMKSQLEPGEKRSEVKVYKGYATIGKEHWYGFSVFLPEGFAINDNWEAVAQWHGTPDFGIGESYRSAAMALYTGNANLSETRGEWTVNVRWDSKRNTFVDEEPVYEGIKTFEFGPYETGVWTDWVFHVKWSYKSDGFLEIWKNRIKVLGRGGPNCFNDAVGPYFKMGIYRGGRGAGEARTIYHDEFKMADANSIYEDVAPGGRPPKPEPRTVDLIITIPEIRMRVTTA